MYLFVFYMFVGDFNNDIGVGGCLGLFGMCLLIFVLFLLLGIRNCNTFCY
jgi:hypothetical protein